MIAIEADARSDWPKGTDWRSLAQQAARAAVAASNAADLLERPLTVEISIKFASDAEVQALNAAYRNKNRATNVLSFPMIEPDLLSGLAVADGGEVLLGDVVIAHGVCASEAAERGISIEAHAAHLVVHGVLHLLGYDHEKGEAEAESMESAERDALASIGIADPYAVTEVHGQI